VSDCKCALVVEDDARSIMAITGLLKTLGISCKRNFTGEDVTDQLQAMEPKPDFILLDLTLPKGDAFEILYVLKADPALCDILVIAIADNEALNLLPATQPAGFDSCFMKPLPRKYFAEMLAEVLSGGQVWQVPV
jgi:CheY-like chemotaxis protein